jgi:hypothetical protein
VAGAVAAPAPAARVVETRLAAPGAAAETAARETGLAVHAVEAARGEKGVATTGEGAGFGPLAFTAAFGCRRGRLLLFEGAPHDLVHEAAPLVSKHKQNYAVLSPLLSFLLSQQPVFADTGRTLPAFPLSKYFFSLNRWYSPPVCVSDERSIV